MSGSIGIGIILLAAGLFFFLKKEEPAPFSRSKFTRITSDGKADNAAISPDGRYISYIERDAGKSSLWVRQIATSSNIQIVPPQTAAMGSLKFSPDGNFIYYLQASEEKNVVWLYRLPVLGGTPVKILSQINSSISFSPDGQKIAFIRISSSTGDFAVYIANVDGAGEKMLVSHKGKLWYDGDPSWSPKGDTIAAGLGSWEGGYHYELFAIDVETGKESRMTDKTWAVINGVEWDSSGRGLMVRGSERGGIRNQVYYVSYPSGNVTSITNDANDYSSSSATTDFNNLCVVQQDPSFQLFFVPEGDTKKAKKISDQKDDGLFGVAVAKDEEIYYASSRGGNVDIWAMNQDGNRQRQVTSTPALESWISLTPNGSQILFTSRSATETPSIWRVNIDGSGMKQLTSGSEDYSPILEPTGRWILFQSWKRGPLTIMKIPAEGGDHMDVSGVQGAFPLPSPDGKTVYFAHNDEEQQSRSLMSVAIDGGKPSPIFEFPHGFSTPLIWRPNTREISFVVRKEGVDNIWVQPIDGGPAKMYTNFPEDNISYYDWMPDGKSLVVSHGHTSADVVLITQEK